MVIGFRFNRFDRRVNLVSRIFMLFFFPTHICRRGIDLPSLLCPIREGVVESSSHLFFYCSLLVSVIFQVYRCRDFPAPSLSSYADWLVWFKALHFPAFAKRILEIVFNVSWWMIWEYMNFMLFGATKPKAFLIFDNIVTKSFFLCIGRCKKDINWVGWLQNPNLAIM